MAARGQRGKRLTGSASISAAPRLQLVAQLAETKISTGDLIGLRIGDIITTEKDVNTPIVISVEGHPKYHARPGALKGRKAIRIEQAMPNAASSESVRGNCSRPPRQPLRRQRQPNPAQFRRRRSSTRADAQNGGRADAKRRYCSRSPAPVQLRVIAANGLTSV